VQPLRISLFNGRRSATTGTYTIGSREPPCSRNRIGPEEAETAEIAGGADDDDSP
jgi:hypothetical protein